MTVYLIAQVKVTDGAWVPAYAASVHDIVHKHGGKYLSRSGNVRTLEGKPLDTTLLHFSSFRRSKLPRLSSMTPNTLLMRRLVRAAAKVALP